MCNIKDTKLWVCFVNTLLYWALNASNPHFDYPNSLHGKVSVHVCVFLCSHLSAGTSECLYVMGYPVLKSQLLLDPVSLNVFSLLHYSWLRLPQVLHSQKQAAQNHLIKSHKTVPPAGMDLKLEIWVLHAHRQCQSSITSQFWLKSFAWRCLTDYEPWEKFVLSKACGLPKVSDFCPIFLLSGKFTKYNRESRPAAQTYTCLQNNILWSTQTNRGNKYLMDLRGLPSDPLRVLYLCSTS